MEDRVDGPMLVILRRHAIFIGGLAIALVLSATLFTPSPPVGVSEKCSQEPDREACYRRYLDTVLQAQGPAAALEDLDTLAMQDPELLSAAHPLAHHLGKETYRHYKDFPKAFSLCRDAYASGCYHGVLEAYLSSRRQVEPQDVAGLCNTLAESRKSQFLKFQCVHGLGHGLTMYFKHDILKALPLCDALPTYWDRNSCYGGVFMENIVAYQMKAEGHSHNHQGEDPSFLDPKDPHFPCNALVRKYKDACYFLQSSVMLTFNGTDWAQTFKECDRAPGDLIWLCYESVGRDISGFTLTGSDKSIELCMLGNPKHRSHCFRGAVNDFIFTHASPERGMTLCRKLGVEYKEDCYMAVGQFLINLYPDQPLRDRACEAAEKPYIGVCKKTSIPL